MKKYIFLILTLVLLSAGCNPNSQKNEPVNESVVVNRKIEPRNSIPVATTTQQQVAKQDPVKSSTPNTLQGMIEAAITCSPLKARISMAKIMDEYHSYKFYDDAEIQGLNGGLCKFVAKRVEVTMQIDEARINKDTEAAIATGQGTQQEADAYRGFIQNEYEFFKKNSLGIITECNLPPSELKLMLTEWSKPVPPTETGSDPNKSSAAVVGKYIDSQQCKITSAIR